MPIRIRFMALSGEFKTVREEIFRDVTAAMPAILAHAKSGNYTNVKRVEDVDSLRFTARTPGGRGGRNIAFGDWEDDESLSAHLRDQSSSRTADRIDGYDRDDTGESPDY